jgi:hypothetical protein
MKNELKWKILNEQTLLSENRCPSQVPKIKIVCFLVSSFLNPKAWEREDLISVSALAAKCSF